MTTPRKDPNLAPFWKQVRVIDADQPLKIMPKEIDLKNAVAQDPEHCVYAECIRRVLHVKRVRVWKSVAYIEGLDDNGETIVSRYRISDASQRLIQTFDKGIGAIQPLLLRAPAPTHTLEKQKEKKRTPEQKKQRRQREQQIKKGLHVPVAPVNEFVRIGVGRAFEEIT